MEYNIIIKKKNIKTIRVSVESGTLLVSAPKYVKDCDIYRYLENNRELVDEMMQKDSERLYQNNIEENIIYLFGEKINSEDAEKIKNEKDLEKFYKKELQDILPYIFEKYNKITGLKENEFKIRKMQRRWGTCYYKKGLININLYLAKRSMKEIELVVLHELTHLKFANHSRDFYSEIEKYFPDYKNINKKLNS